MEIIVGETTYMHAKKMERKESWEDINVT